MVMSKIMYEKRYMRIWDEYYVRIQEVLCVSQSQHNKQNNKIVYEKPYMRLWTEHLHLVKGFMNDGVGDFWLSQ